MELLGFKQIRQKKVFITVQTKIALVLEGRDVFNVLDSLSYCVSGLSIAMANA